MRSLVLVLALCWPALAAADAKVLKTAKVTLEVPAKWKVEVTDDTMKGESDNKAIALLVWAVDTADVAEATKKLDGELYTAVSNLAWGKPTKGKVHGLPASYVDGTGRSVAGIVDIKIVVVGPTPAKKGVIVVTAVEHAKLAANKAAIKAVLGGVKPGK